ncbi:DUF5988 family protein [Streptomyces sp. NPDC088097]|uniref:DUF5988 family protein n=1 Tax=Streptomyces sp. NPDC088097 TaxID=3365823 RepID=UPI0037F78875
MLLVGGPEGTPTEHAQPDDLSADIRLRHLNRYEHYRPTGFRASHDGYECLVYRWAYSTYIAE